MKFVYDMKLRQPACVLLQVAMGGDPRLANRLPAECWLIAPTPDMKLYEIDETQFAEVVEYHHYKQKREEK